MHSTREDKSEDDEDQRTACGGPQGKTPPAPSGDEDDDRQEWCPLLGGRKIPTFLPLVLGGVGNALLYRISATLIIRFGSIWLGLANGRTPADGMNGWQVAILVAAYAPMLLLWAPALTIGLIGYWRRRTTL